MENGYDIHNRMWRQVGPVTWGHGYFVDKDGKPITMIDGYTGLDSQRRTPSQAQTLHEMELDADSDTPSI